MSLETTPTTTTPGMSRPLATRLVPTSTSTRPSVKASSTRSAAPRRSTMSRSRRADAQHREAFADLALDAFRAAAEVADPRRRAVRAAGRERCRATAVVAAQGRAGLVIDEGALAIRAGLDVTAVAAQDDGRAPPPVQDQDGLVARAGVEGSECGHERSRQEPAFAGGQLGAQVHDLDRRQGADGASEQGDAPVRPHPGPPDVSTAGVADPRTTAAPASSPRRIATSRAWSRGVRSLL